MFTHIQKYSVVLVIQWFSIRQIKPRQTILINHAKYGFLIKTVAFVDHYGLIWCKGENAQCITIEKLGPIGKNDVIG